jgi:threonine/homoserine/homoserine lactone efflux protein
MLPGVDHLWLFIAAGLLLNLTPGPDVVYIVGSAMRRGARAGLVAALGVTAGCFVHVLAAGLGVTALVAASSTAFFLLKLLGAAYLVWLGLRLLFARVSSLVPADAASGASAEPTDAAPDHRAVFWGGFLTNVLNPKVALFFLAFLQQFISTDASSNLGSFLLLGLLFNVNGLWVNGGYALLASWLARRVAQVRRGTPWFERVVGALLAGFGLKLAFAPYPHS